MEDYSFEQKTEREQNITALSAMSFADLNEEAELDMVDFETLMEEIRVS